MHTAFALILAVAFLGTPARGQTEADRLAEVLGLRSGSAVADVGAGGGDFALAFAARVGAGGRVYATELDAGKLDEIRARAKQAGLGNVTAVEAQVAATGLPTACCDAVLLRDVYHHLTEPAAIDRDLLRAMKPGAVLVVVDFPPTWYLRPFTPAGVGAERAHHGIEREAALAELLAAGFERVRVIEPWSVRWLAPDPYALVVRKPGAAP